MIPSEDFTDVTLAIEDSDDFDDHGDHNDLDVHEHGWAWMKIDRSGWDG